VQHVDIVIAILAVLALAWAADQITGRRGLFGASLVSATGAACGWFLAVRVFGAATMDELGWTLWSGAGSVLSLFTFYLFRNTR
jgi:hypothetical protein